MAAQKIGELSLKPFFLLLALGWTVLVLFSAAWTVRQQNRDHLELALIAARSQAAKDLLLREWNIRHGFVYAPVSDFNQPNPYLIMPEREITTPSGRTFTAINSSAMIRQLYELAASKNNYFGHLTSLTPLRPENAPDPWEAAALRQLQEGQPEVYGVGELKGVQVMRLMLPLTATPRCLNCHSGLDFQPGKVAGGLSIALPLEPFMHAQNLTVLWGAHGILWLVGLVGLLIGNHHLQRRITANKELAAALARRDEEKQILLNNIPALVYRGYIDGRVEFVDDKVEKVTGYSREKFASGELKWPEIILEEDRAEAKRIFVAALKGEKTYRREYRIRTRDGKIVWLSERSQIVCDEEGRIRFVSGVISDITPRKEMEKALAESERFWKSLLEKVGVGILLSEKNSGRVREVNPRAVAMLGYPREAIVGQERQKFIAYRPPDENSREASRAGIEAFLLRADGSRIPILKTCALVDIDGIPYVLESFIDLSAQRAAEQALAEANARLQRMIREVEQNNQEMNTLNRMVELLQVCQNLEEAYPILEQFAAKLFPNLPGGIYLLNPSNNLLQEVVTWGGTLASENLFSPQDCWALRQGKKHLSSRGGDAVNDPPCRHIHPRAEGYFFCHPLIAQGENIGLLYLQKTAAAGFKVGSGVLDKGFAPAQERLGTSLAENISLALANLRLRESLRYQAIRDPLTGLFNRRYLQETLEREIYRVARKQAGLGVIMLDVDHFKQFNDTYGHEAGDRLLAVLGRYLKHAIRAEDIACRYGGEEFTLVLPEITLETLKERAEAIRVGVPTLEVEYHGQILTGVTISLGVSYFPQHGSNGDQLLEAADKALYRAKRGGRNRVVVAGQPEESPALLTAPDSRIIQLAS